MLKSLAAMTLAAGAFAAPAAADGQSQWLSACHAEAARISPGGAKYGYAARYNEAVEACMARYHAHAAPRTTYSQTRTVITAPYVGCYPGAPTMYRGTLYCVD